MDVFFIIRLGWEPEAVVTCAASFAVAKLTAHVQQAATISTATMTTTRKTTTTATTATTTSKQ